MDTLNVVDTIGAILIPIILLFLGQWFIRQKKKSDKAKSEAEQLAAFLKHLASENDEEKKLALLALKHLHDAKKFPTTLLDAVRSITESNNPSIAAFAYIALGEPVGEAKDVLLLSEVLLPMKLNFERTRSAFDLWLRIPASKPNERLEDAIKESNTIIRDLLVSKWHLIPNNYHKDALKLIEHYNAWLAEYDRVRPGGVRNPKELYVFVGTKGVPFPSKSERRFMNLYEDLKGKTEDRGRRTKP